MHSIISKLQKPIIEIDIVLTEEQKTELEEKYTVLKAECDALWAELG